MPTSAVLPEQFGRYRILRKLGEGGMGAVYLAEDGQLGRRVAVKVPHFAAADSPEVIERFYREARVAAAIEHPNLCPIYDVGRIDGIHYLTMPFIDGNPLGCLLDRNQPWPAARAARLVIRLGTALHVVHQQGIMHRDLKPGNILMRAGDDPVIMDFGLARSLTHSDRLTRTGDAVGTPAYMSPEQIESDPQAVGSTTDIYSLGVILYELVTGQLPFSGPGLLALYGQKLHAQLQPPSVLQPGLDAALDAICCKALARQAGDRYATMAEFAAALQRYLSARQAGGAAKPHLRVPTAALDLAAAGMPTTMRLVCPTCGKKLRVPTGSSGKSVRCPGCYQRVNIVQEASARPSACSPVLVSDALTPTVRPPTSNTERAARRRAPRVSLGVLVGAGVAMTLLVLLVLAWLWPSSRLPNGREQTGITVLPGWRPTKKVEVTPKEAASVERPKTEPLSQRPDPPKKGEATQPTDGIASQAVVQSILDELQMVPPIRSVPGADNELRVGTLPSFSAKVLEPYQADYMSLAEIEKNPTKYPLRVAVLKAANVLCENVNKFRMKEYLPGTTTAQIKNQILKEQVNPGKGILWLEEALDDLKKAGEGRAKETSKRWQANYDYVMARLESRLVFLCEYNYLLAQIRSDSLPPLENGATGYRLGFKKKVGIPETKVKDWVKEIDRTWQRIAQEHADTPWAFVANGERMTQLGLEWRPMQQ